MSIPDYIVFGKPRFSEEEIDDVAQTLRGGWAGTGPRVKEFQSAFGKYVGTERAVAVGSCTAALHLAMVASGIGEGDEVITTPLTFAATANAVVHSGAVPVFADVDRTSMNIDPAEIEKHISPRTRAILAVHYAGRPCDMDALRLIAHRYGLLLIEDAAHAIESRYHGKKVGSIGDISCFSFYVTKNISTIEGGMLCTNRDDIASKAQILALHGMSADAWARFSDRGYKHYDVIYTGFKYNMTDVQAVLGLHQLARIDFWHRRREVIWKQYDEAFADLPCGTPPPAEADTIHARHLYTLQIDQAESGISRDEFMMAMHQAGIGCGVHYRALHTQPFYRKQFGHRPEDFPIANMLGERTVSIPLSQHLTDAEVERVISTVRATLKRIG